MADYCQQCSIEEFGEDFGDLAGLSTPKDTAAGRFALGFCEGCVLPHAPSNLVDHLGRCVSDDCFRKHGLKQ